jgi:hypothetical protein
MWLTIKGFDPQILKTKKIAQTIKNIFIKVLTNYSFVLNSYKNFQACIRRSSLDFTNKLTYHLFQCKPFEVNKNFC